MSRSAYSEDCDGWELVMYRGAVSSAIKGRRGQKLLSDMAVALDAMPEKKLIANELVCDEGVCALGALGLYRAVRMDGIHPEDTARVASMFDAAPALIREIVYENDEGAYETPEQRWVRMRKWVESNSIHTSAKSNSPSTPTRDDLR